MLVYSPEFTNKSKLASCCLKDLNFLCIRDYGESFFENEVVCLDLDAYESSCVGENKPTIDAAIGIADYQNNRTSSDRHLLVELRFGYKSTKNFDFTNMKHKVMHSRDILIPEPVNESVIFLYDERIVPQVRNIFNRLSKQDNEVKRWLPMGINGFWNYIYDIKTLPYIPENDLANIEKDLTCKYEVGGLNAIDRLVNYWIEEMMKYNLRYKQAESSAVAEVILNFLLSIIPNEKDLEKEYLLLLIEQVRTFIV